MDVNMFIDNIPMPKMFELRILPIPEKIIEEMQNEVDYYIERKNEIDLLIKIEGIHR